MREYDQEFGFFVVMSGCVIREDNSIKTLTPEGILALANKRYFVERIRSQTIEGRSKFGLFGKFVVCVQILWFFIRSVASSLLRNPVTLIEIHTMVQLVCTILLYALWWKVGPSYRLRGTRNVLTSSLRTRRMLQIRVLSIQRTHGSRIFYLRKPTVLRKPSPLLLLGQDMSPRSQYMPQISMQACSMLGLVGRRLENSIPLKDCASRDVDYGISGLTFCLL